MYYLFKMHVVGEIYTVSVNVNKKKHTKELSLNDIETEIKARTNNKYFFIFFV